MPGPDERDAVRSMLEPDAGPSRQLIGDLLHQCGNITHLPIVCRRRGPAIVNLAGVIGIDFSADHGSPAFDWTPSSADPPGVTRVPSVAGPGRTGRLDGYVIVRSPDAIAATHHSDNVIDTDQAVGHDPRYG